MTISLENAKKLYEVAKKHGVELPKNRYWWIRDVFGNNKEFFVSRISDRKYKYPAYTTDELLEWLPEKIEWDGISGFLELYKSNSYMAVYNDNAGVYIFEEEAKTPADALCKLCICLIEEEILK